MKILSQAPGIRVVSSFQRPLTDCISDKRIQEGSIHTLPTIYETLLAELRALSSATSSDRPSARPRSSSRMSTCGALFGSKSTSISATSLYWSPQHEPNLHRDAEHGEHDKLELIE